MELLNSLFLEQQELRKRVEGLEEIMEQLILWEKIERLEKEKAGLLTEIRSFREKGERKAHELEDEVTSLKKEVRALKRLLRIREEPIWRLY